MAESQAQICESHNGKCVYKENVPALELIKNVFLNLCDQLNEPLLADETFREHLRNWFAAMLKPFWRDSTKITLTLYILTLVV